MTPNELYFHDFVSLQRSFYWLLDHIQLEFHFNSNNQNIGLVSKFQERVKIQEEFKKFVSNLERVYDYASFINLGLSNPCKFHGKDFENVPAPSSALRAD